VNYLIDKDLPLAEGTIDEVQPLILKCPKCKGIFTNPNYIRTMEGETQCYFCYMLEDGSLDLSVVFPD